MRSCIYKYLMPDPGRADSVYMPVGAEILDVQMQNGNIEAWALVDADQYMNKERTFFTVGTGQLFPYDNVPIEHLGTVQNNGKVWHVFEVMKP